LKAGAQTKSLGEVCEISSVLVDPRRGEYLNMLHVGGANIESKTGELIELKTAREEGLISGKFVFEDDAVLYSKIRPYLMKVARPNFRGLCSADIYPLSVKPEQLDRDYLFYLLLSSKFTDFANAGSARAGMPKVNRDHLFAFRVCLPPLPEQRRIVAILDEAFDGIAAAKATAERNLENARALYESHMQGVFGQRGEGWVETTLGTEVDLLAGFAFKSTGYTETNGGVRLLRGDNIMQRALRWADVKKWPASDVAEYNRYQLKVGDVVLGYGFILPPDS
jgi:Type I restriction modification DNA specificity domain